MITLSVKGLEELLRAFADAPGIIREEAEDAADTVLGDVSRKAAEYPPAPPASTYIRTGTLGRGWTATYSRWQGNQRTLTNPTSYGHWVQSDDRQAWMHVGRWRTVGQILRDHARQTDQALDKASQRAVTRIIQRAGR